TSSERKYGRWRNDSWTSMTTRARFACMTCKLGPRTRPRKARSGPRTDRFGHGFNVEDKQVPQTPSTMRRGCREPEHPTHVRDEFNVRRTLPVASLSVVRVPQAPTEA